MINPAKLFKLKGYWETFAGNHPRFPQFMKAVQSTGIEEGTVIEISVTTTDGKTLSTNVKVSASDKDLLNELTELAKSK